MGGKGVEVKETVSSERILGMWCAYFHVTHSPM